MGTALIAVIAAAGGWLAVLLIGRPVRDFFDLRREVRRRMIEFSNIPARWNEAPDAPGARIAINISSAEAESLNEAERVLLCLASQMASFAETETIAVWALKQIGFDPAKAGRGLIGLSNTVDTYGNSHAFYMRSTEEALMLGYARRRAHRR
jgi:hypothetical protein